MQSACLKIRHMSHHLSNPSCKNATISIHGSRLLQTLIVAFLLGAAMSFRSGPTRRCFSSPQKIRRRQTTRKNRPKQQKRRFSWPKLSYFGFIRSLNIYWPWSGSTLSRAAILAPSSLPSQTESCVATMPGILSYDWTKQYHGLSIQFKFQTFCCEGN